MIDITPIVNAVLKLAAAVVVAFLIPYIRERTTNAQRARYLNIVKTLVTAAEQIFGRGAGEDKLRYVKEELAKRGLNFEEAEIEAAVLEEFGHFERALIGEVIDDEAEG